MPFRFPETLREVDILFEPPTNYSFQYSIACSNDVNNYNSFGVAIDTVTNYIYVAEHNKIYHCYRQEGQGRLCIFSEKGEHLHSYTHRDMKAPWGIAIHGNNAYVTDIKAHAVFHLRISGTQLHLLARKGIRGSAIGQFDYPHQLSVSVNKEIFVADYKNNRIQILDSSVHPIGEIRHPSIRYPRDVKLTADEMYVLTAFDATCIHVFSHKGVKIRSLITRGKGMQMVIPSFFCIDANQGLVIGDLRTNDIKVFSSEGVLLHKIGEQEHQVGMFHQPSGVTLIYNPNFKFSKLVVVSQNENYNPQIFFSE